MPNHSHEPLDIDREQVARLAGWGLNHDQIAIIVGISDKTLRKHYRHELSLGVAQAHSEVGKSLFQMATSDRNVQAAIWWSKARMGWREAARLPEEQPAVSTLKVEFRWADDTPAALNAPPGASHRRGAHEPPTIDGQATEVAFREPETEAKPPQKRSRRG